MTTAARVLEIVDAHQPTGALSDAFADGYLLQKNPIFRLVRLFLLQRGYRFECEGALAMRYRSAPLLMLPAILKSKAVPYLANGKALRDLASEASLVEMRLEDLELLLAKNEVLHESAHGVAEELLPRHPNESLASDARIIRSMIAESFANAAELVAVLETRSELERWLMGFHTHHTAPARLRAAFDSFSARHGKGSAIQWLIWAFLRVNLLQDSESALAHWKSMAALHMNLDNDWDTAQANDLFSYASNLNPRFRTDTARVYFKAFHGMEDVVREIAKIEAASHMTRHGRRWIQLLAEFLAQPVLPAQPRFASG